MLERACTFLNTDIGQLLGGTIVLALAIGSAL